MNSHLAATAMAWIEHEYMLARGRLRRPGRGLDLEINPSQKPPRYEASRQRTSG